jgi:hypothetical protein
MIMVNKQQQSVSECVAMAGVLAQGRAACELCNSSAMHMLAAEDHSIQCNLSVQCVMVFSSRTGLRTVLHAGQGRFAKQELRCPVIFGCSHKLHG